MAERAEAGARRAPARREATCWRRRARIGSTPIASPRALESAPQAHRASGRRHVHPAFVTRLLQRCAGATETTASRLQRQLDAALAARGQTIEDAIRAEGQHQAAAAGVDGEPDRQPAADRRRSTGASSSRASAWSSRCCSAIRPASTAGWTSAAATAIATPSRSWPSRPAKGSCVLALKSVERARQVAEPTPDARAAHVGYHLIGGGRRQFERSVAWRPDSGAARPAARSSRCATPGYLGHDRRRHRRCSSPLAVRYACAHGWRGAPLVARRAADARPGQRAGDPARSARRSAS